MNSREALVALNMVPHVGPVRLRQLLARFDSPEAILAAPRHALMSVAGISEVTADAIASWESTIDLSGELKKVEDFGCHVLTQQDENYPELLRQIYDPPIVLYVKGTLTTRDKNSVALVGSRMTTSYGMNVGRKLSYQLAYMGVTVVSGGARGIDTAAHQGALSAKGRTIAVLGTGINIVFPAENAQLFEKIISNGALVTQQDENYPELLRQIYDPPIVLYVKGTLTTRDKNSVALVGSRMTTSYGMNVGRKLSYKLAYMGITVVSGGARGIDTAAHQGALSAKGRTVAVLGTGINIVFPAENAQLFEKITSNGALITQFPFNRPADKQSFPIRNRIVAGMTLGTVVVEANLTSGALITANFAVENGRQVFAVPGPIDSPRSKGCHDLIKKGAKLCEGAEDIVTEFEYLFPTTNKSSAGGPQLPGLTLTENEKLAYDALGAEELYSDDIIEKTGLPASAVSVALLTLEMKRLVKQMPGKLFVRVSRE